MRGATHQRAFKLFKVIKMLNLGVHGAHCINMKTLSEQEEEARQYLIDGILDQEGFVTSRDRKSIACRKRMDFLQTKPFSYLVKVHG